MQSQWETYNPHHGPRGFNVLYGPCWSTPSLVCPKIFLTLVEPLLGLWRGPKLKNRVSLNRFAGFCWPPRTKNWFILVKMEVDWLTEKVLEGTYSLFLRKWRFPKIHDFLSCFHHCKMLDFTKSSISQKWRICTFQNFFSKSVNFHSN